MSETTSKGWMFDENVKRSGMHHVYQQKGTKAFPLTALLAVVSNSTTTQQPSVNIEKMGRGKKQCTSEKNIPSLEEKKRHACVHNPGYTYAVVKHGH